MDDKGNRKINPLFYPFLFATFVYGFGFLFFGWWSGVESSSLYQSFYGLHSILPAIWGVCATAAGLFAMALLLFRHGAYGHVAAQFGWLVWLFAAIVYGIGGYWLPLFTVAVPNAYFWVYYYFKVKQYERDKEAGLLTDPQ